MFRIAKKEKRPAAAEAAIIFERLRHD